MSPFAIDCDSNSSPLRSQKMSDVADSVLDIVSSDGYDEEHWMVFRYLM